MTLVSAANLFLLFAALFALIVLAIPQPETCWIPPNAPTRGFYSECWSESFLWASEAE